MIKNFSLRPCKALRPHCGNSSGSDDTSVDRFSSLPNELLIRILSFLPTKDAAITTVVSKKFLRDVFPWMTSLNLDDFVTKHCLGHHPNLINRFEIFKRFVDNILQVSKSPNLYKYKLHFGGDIRSSYLDECRVSRSVKCDPSCFSVLKPSHLLDWISYPITRPGIREIDLRILVRNPGELPQALFTCETLEVLKLEVNLALAQVCAMPSFHLPNLKVFHLTCLLIPENAFLSRIVSSCPLLEDLAVFTWLQQDDILTLSSPSLRRLYLVIVKPDCPEPIGLVRLDTPNLQYLRYGDDLAYRYSLTNMNALVEARIGIEFICSIVAPEVSFQSMLSLVRALYNVQHLSLEASCIEALDLGQLKDQLPLFRNVKCLELGHNRYFKWNEVLVEFLDKSPFLETLVFASGICVGTPRDRVDAQYNEATESERQYFGTTQVIPLCCKFHLKRIVVERYKGTDRELELLKFFLRTSSVLEELVMRNCKVDKRLVESTLSTLPRASITFSIIF